MSNLFVSTKSLRISIFTLDFIIVSFLLKQEIDEAVKKYMEYQL